jgi:hypothetical protein
LRTARDFAEGTSAGWKTLEQADVLPQKVRSAIEKWIQLVAASILS